ncbi:hypothetical protein BJ912DRAFT_847117 [Pholiota molesta]|nr:hypothetical protein BJ912DRAFT_847117 [Pholiota molesta]
MVSKKNCPILHRLLSTQRKYSTAKLRKAYLQKKPRRKLTPAQKASQVESRRKARESLKADLLACRQLITAEAEKLQEKHGGHSVEFYRKAILQEGRLKLGRKVSPWNGWVYLEGARLNEGEFPIHSLASYIDGLLASWDKMNEEERATAAAPGVAKILEERETKTLAIRNTPISSFHDTRRTLELLDHEIRALHARTSTEVLVIAVRKSNDQFNAPAVLVTSDRIMDFFDISVKEPLADFAMRFEAFSLSGVQGAAAGVPVPRMWYSGFDNAITAKYAVVLECWPLDKFCPPSDIASRNELNVLLNAFQSGATRFRKLSPIEFTAWSAQHISASAASSLRAADAVTNHPTSNPDAQTPFAPPLTTTLRSNDENAPPAHSMTTIPAKRTATTSPLQTITHNFGVTANDGTNISVVKKPRKERKDKGKPRGPRTKKA